MKVKVYCERCSIYEEMEVTETSVDTQSGNSSIPIPKMKGGLTKYSVVHDNHTLIVDVDKNGDVRGYQIIDRLNLSLEELLSTISAKIISHASKDPKKNTMLLIISPTRKLHILGLGVANQLMLNIPDDKSGMLSVNKKEVILEFANVKIVVADWNDKYLTFDYDECLMILEFTPDNIESYIELITKSKSENVANHYGILFSQKVTRSPLWSDILQKIIKQYPGIPISDASDNFKASMSLSQIIHNFLN
ncbi:MAG: hypothetical protein OEY49_10995 [Candidatus Heimdallarchaeota archaeon]|nr:hypothetical protein [Candidatus Heimdallarchaeota archaeon]